MAKNQNNNVAPATQKTEPGAKKDALATALAQIEKQFGKGAIMKLGDNTAMQVDAISTGSLGLDLALGVGGVPRGRIIEVFGPESSGKTTLALHILAEAQKKGGEVAFIDVEHALDLSEILSRMAQSFQHMHLTEKAYIIFCNCLIATENHPSDSKARDHM